MLHIQELSYRSEKLRKLKKILQQERWYLARDPRSKRSIKYKDHIKRGW